MPQPSSSEGTGADPGTVTCPGHRAPQCVTQKTAGHAWRFLTQVF